MSFQDYINLGILKNVMLTIACVEYIKLLL